MTFVNSDSVTPPAEMMAPFLPIPNNEEGWQAYRLREDRRAAATDIFIQHISQVIAEQDEILANDYNDLNNRIQSFIAQRNRIKNDSFSYKIEKCLSIIINKTWVLLVDIKTKLIFAVVILKNFPKQICKQYDECSEDVRKKARIITVISAFCGVIAIASAYRLIH